MKITSKIFVICLSLIAGCTSLPRSNVGPVSIAISEPPINSINSSQVGDVMLRQGEYTEQDAIYVSQIIDVGAYNIFPGNYIKTGENEEIESFMPGGDQAGRVEKKSMLVDNWSSVIIKKGSSPRICVLTVYGTAITTCSGEHQYKYRKIASPTRDSFQQTLIYSGRIGNKINIGYREFSNNLARPAFSNNVEYDLSQSMTIGYKGAQLEIIEATNQLIKYRVIRNFNDAVR